MALQQASVKTEKKRCSRAFIAKKAKADREKLIEFKRNGQDREYKYEAVAQEINDAADKILADDAMLPRNLTAHISRQTQRIHEISDTGGGAVKCGNNTCQLIAEFVCTVCGEDPFCTRCYRINLIEIHKRYRAIRSCHWCNNRVHTMCGKVIESRGNMRLKCDRCIAVRQRAPLSQAP